MATPVTAAVDHCEDTSGNTLATKQSSNHPLSAQFPSIHSPMPFLPVYASVEGISQSKALSKVEVERVYEPQGHRVVTACVHGHYVRYSWTNTQQATAIRKVGV